MIPFKEEIENIKEQIISIYSPNKIILFGSCASGCAKKDSDIDLCIICDYEDKKKLLNELLINLEYSRDVDFVLYKPSEWDKYKEDTSSFANIINRKGVPIYG
jgi:predicted nucleotidyltransferase